MNEDEDDDLLLIKEDDQEEENNDDDLLLNEEADKSRQDTVVQSRNTDIVDDKSSFKYSCGDFTNYLLNVIHIPTSLNIGHDGAGCREGGVAVVINGDGKVCRQTVLLG